MTVLLAVAITLSGSAGGPGNLDAHARETVAAWESQFADDPAVAEYLAVTHYLDLIHAEQVAVADYLASLPKPAPARAPVPSSSSSTGACGGATNGADAFIARESGGNPSIFNSQGSGAYGCYQIMPGTWAGSCADLGPQIGAPASVQAACASRLPLSAWNPVTR